MLTVSVLIKFVLLNFIFIYMYTITILKNEVFFLKTVGSNLWAISLAPLLSAKLAFVSVFTLSHSLQKVSLILQNWNYTYLTSFHYLVPPNPWWLHWLCNLMSLTTLDPHSHKWNFKFMFLLLSFIEDFLYLHFRF